MAAAVGALRMEVRPPFIMLAAIASVYVVVGLNLVFNEKMRESAKPPAPPLERSKKAARAKLPPLPTRNETRRATPPPRTETVKIRPAEPNAKIGPLPKSSIAKIEPVKPDARISPLSKKSKAAKAAAKKHAQHLTAMRAKLPPLPLRNAKRQATGAANTATASRRAKAVPLQTGKASWYDFHGQTTANGETMDRGALTAAHKTLPLGSMVVVQNVGNGREVEVRINDRGPFGRGRIIDLSKAAAAQIDMLGDGVAKVIVRPIAAGAGGAPALR
jgi:rare lipoprotein A